MDGAPGDPWTHAQVEARRDASVDQIVAEWNDSAPQVEAILDTFGPGGVQLLFDLVTHEHDIRLALGLPAARDLAVHPIVGEWLLNRVSDSAREQGAPPLRIVTPEGAWTVGDGEPSGTLTAPLFEVLRMATGRRSEAQVRALDWGGTDPGPYLALFGSPPFTISAVDIDER
jgi:uncharacterized protein (TIGR03083 family)